MIKIQRQFILRTLLVFSLAGVSWARAEETGNPFRERMNEIADVGFDKTGLLILAAGLGATALAQTQDYATRAAWSNYQRMSPDTARVGDFLGRGYFGIAVALTHLYFDSVGGRAHAESLVATFLTTAFLKEINRRERPASENHQSMPSGHTSIMFATSTSLLYSHGWTWAAPVYLLSAFTAASRWSDDAHWLSDTVAGATVGIFWGRATRTLNLGVEPIVSSNLLGLGWRMEF